MGRVRLRSWKQLPFVEVRRNFHVPAAQIAQRLCNALMERLVTVTLVQKVLPGLLTFMFLIASRSMRSLMKPRIPTSFHNFPSFVLMITFLVNMRHFGVFSYMNGTAGSCRRKDSPRKAMMGTWMGTLYIKWGTSEREPDHGRVG